jgi:hypothetical protein
MAEQETGTVKVSIPPEVMVSSSARRVVMFSFTTARSSVKAIEPWMKDKKSSSPLLGGKRPSSARRGYR